MQEIKPCRFCGEMPHMRYLSKDAKLTIMIEDELFAFSCCNPNCKEEDRMKGDTGYYPTKEEAIANWNKRQENFDKEISQKQARKKKARRKKCHYFCNGYCFWNGDRGEVCDTFNNSHDGYCPMAESDKELEEYAKFLMEQENEDA